MEGMTIWEDWCVKRKREKDSQGKDPRTFEENHQGRDPRTKKETSLGEHPRTLEESSKRQYSPNTQREKGSENPRSTS